MLHIFNKVFFFNDFVLLSEHLILAPEDLSIIWKCAYSWSARTTDRSKRWKLVETQDAEHPVEGDEIYSLLRALGFEEIVAKCANSLCIEFKKNVGFTIKHEALVLIAQHLAQHITDSESLEIDHQSLVEDQPNRRS